MPLDPQPHPDLGNIWVDPASGEACVVTGEELQRAKANGERLFVSHYATCKNAASHRKPKEPTADTKAVRACPFDGCDARVSPELFSCPAHWRSLSEPLRAEVWDSYRAYQRGDIGVEELRKLQQDVLDAAQGRTL